MPTLQINAQTVTVADGATLMAAARQLGIDVPSLCWRDGLAHVTSCMLCVVEDVRTGELYPSCSRPAAEGMQIATGSEAVLAARRTALELLLGDHLGDCEGPCRRACAAGMNIPLMLHHIASGNPRDAIRVIKQHIALPATLGRICPAPCEKICRRGAHDAPVGICLLKRFAADVDLAAPEPYRPDVAAASGFHVAIVGAGPAGLSAAYALLRDGHACTLFEKQDRPGGGLRDPELRDKLPPDVLDAEMVQLTQLGLTWRTGVTLGETISLDALKQQFDAIIIAWGETTPGQIRATGLVPGPHGVAVDRKTQATLDPQVFACGSAVFPGHLAVRATGQGFAAAAAVDQFLRGLPVTGSARLYDHRITGALDPDEMVVLLADADPGPRVVPAGGYTVDEALREAARCLHCECLKPQTCLLRQQAGAHAVDPRAWRAPERRRIMIERRGGITYDPGKCIACGICVRLTAAAHEPLGLTFIGRGFDVRVGVPFHESLDAGLGRMASECVAACPTGALSSRLTSTGGDWGRLPSGEGGERCQAGAWRSQGARESTGVAPSRCQSNKTPALLLGLALLLLFRGLAAGAPARARAASWPIARGDAALTGTTPAHVPDRPVLRWQFNMTSKILGSPVIHDGTLYAAALDGDVVALQLQTGELRWRIKLPAPVEASPLLAVGLLFVGDRNGTLHALDSASGQSRWSYSSEGQIMGGANMAPGRTNLIVFGSYDSKLHAVDAATGKGVWTYATDNYVNGIPAVLEGLVVIGGCDERVHVVNVNDGTGVAMIEAGSYVAASPALRDGHAYVGHYNGDVLGIDLSTKQVRWRFEAEGEPAFFASPAVTATRVLIGGRHGVLHSLARDTGREIWQYRAQGNIDSAPVVTADRILFGSKDGRITMLRFADGERLWSFLVGSPVNAGVAVVDGWIVAGGTDGVLYAFGEAP